MQIAFEIHFKTLDVPASRPLPANSRVTDVAFARGFSDLSHFSRVFKNEFGYSPRPFISRAVDQKLAQNAGDALQRA